MHKKTSKGVLLLPMPYEIYIIGANASEHRKGMRLEGPKLKKPTAEQIQKLEKHVGSGHLGFGDEAFKKVGGGELVDHAHSGSSLMFAPDGDSVYGAGENFRQDMMVACMSWLRGYIIRACC